MLERLAAIAERERPAVIDQCAAIADRYARDLDGIPDCPDMTGRCNYPAEIAREIAEEIRELKEQGE